MVAQEALQLKIDCETWPDKGWHLYLCELQRREPVGPSSLLIPCQMFLPATDEEDRRGFSVLKNKLTRLIHLSQKTAVQSTRIDCRANMIFSKIEKEIANLSLQSFCFFFRFCLFSKEWPRLSFTENVAIFFATAASEVEVPVNFFFPLIELSSRP